MRRQMIKQQLMFFAKVKQDKEQKMKRVKESVQTYHRQE